MTTMLHGDCTEMLPTLPSASVQCIVTSPPYFGLRDYGLPPTRWPSVEYVPMAGLPSITIPAMVCCLGLEFDPLAYIAHLVHVFRLARTAMRDDGTAWLNLGDSYAQDSKWGGRSGGENYTSAAGGISRERKRTGLKDKDLMMIPARAALALQADGWWVRNQVIWQKPNAMPESVTDRLTNDYEAVYLLTKSPRYYFDHAAIAEPAQEHHAAAASFKRNGNKRSDALVPGNNASHRSDRAEKFYSGGTRNRRTVWRIATEHLHDEHYAPMPQSLVEPCILAGSRPGDTVLDMFAGSGTVLRVAERLQRNSIGIDLNADYIEIQKRRTNGVQVELFV